LQFRARSDLFYAGQITGVEGYMGKIATGMLAGINAARVFRRLDPLVLPEDTMLGALLHYITHTPMQDFQPMKAIFGILPPLTNPVRSKRERALDYARRAAASLSSWAAEYHIQLEPQKL
jgi:methylenetetrahydrofolate--tRNA-(uracil-5-)-methyltransferase